MVWIVLYLRVRVLEPNRLGSVPALSSTSCMALSRFLGLAKPQFFHPQNGDDEHLLYSTMWGFHRAPCAVQSPLKRGSSWLSLVPFYTCLLLSFLPFPASLYSFFFFFCPIVSCLKLLLKSDEIWKNKWMNKVNTIIASRHTRLKACLFFRKSFIYFFRFYYENSLAVLFYFASLYRDP